MKLYHRTNHAASILVDGFKDGVKKFSGKLGVWLADSPVDIDQGGFGEQVLEVVVSDEIAAEHELAMNKDERIFFIPAATLNRYGKPRICEEAEFPQLPMPTAEELEEMLRSDELEN